MTDLKEVIGKHAEYWKTRYDSAKALVGAEGVTVEMVEATLVIFETMHDLARDETTIADLKSEGRMWRDEIENSSLKRRWMIKALRKAIGHAENGLEGISIGEMMRDIGK